MNVNSNLSLSLMNQIKNNRIVGVASDDSTKYYSKYVQTIVHPIPVGTQVTFRAYICDRGFHGDTILRGRIEKLLYPGYFKRYDYSDCIMKYCISNIVELPGFSITIPELNLIDPDRFRLYHDEQYRINYFNSLNNSNNNSRICFDSSRGIKGHIKFNNLSGIFK